MSNNYKLEPMTEMDWLWYKPDDMTDKLLPGDGFYFYTYKHAKCDVLWVEIVSDEIKANRPRCFNCGRWVTKTW